MAIASKLDVFYNTLRTFYDSRIALERKPVVAGVTVSNWSKQSIGNRESSYSVVANATIGNETISVHLSGWQPTRSGALGYDGELTQSSVSGSADIWSQYRDGQIKSENVARESIACMAYFFDQLLTGKIVSSESAGKAYMLREGLATLKPKTFDITVKLAADQPEMSWNIASIRSLLGVCKPRIQAILDLDDRRVGRKARAQRSVVKL